MFVRIAKKVNQFFLALLAALVIGAIVFAFGFKIYTNKYYKADVDTITQIEEQVGDTVDVYYDDDLLVFVPKQVETKAVIVFYAGAKVEFQSYSALMYELADRGCICLLPRMPENLAFLNMGAVDNIKQNYAEWVKYVDGVDWYLAGHSLGGVAATQYLGEQADGEYKGVILCGSYTQTDLSKRDLKLLSIYGSEDGLINKANYESSKTMWPKNSQEYVIEGGCHAYFGCYGHQKDDGEPTLTNQEQIEIAADVISSFISE